MVRHERSFEGFSRGGDVLMCLGCCRTLDSEHHREWLKQEFDLTDEELTYWINLFESQDVFDMPPKEGFTDGNPDTPNMPDFRRISVNRGL